MTPMKLPPKLRSDGWVGDGARVGVSVGIYKKVNTIRRRRTRVALEVGDHRLLEDGGERGGAHDSDVVAFETASEGWDGDGERVGVSTGADTKANTQAPIRG